MSQAHQKRLAAGLNRNCGTNPDNCVIEGWLNTGEGREIIPSDRLTEEGLRAVAKMIEPQDPSEQPSLGRRVLTFFLDGLSAYGKSHPHGARDDTQEPRTLIKPR